MLTTDGRLFSWGGLTPSLGRDQDQDTGNDGNYMSSNRNILGMATESTAANDLEGEVGEVEFTTESGNTCAPIVQIATGRNHVLALDTTGKIYSWGRNDYGQLGLG